MADISAGMAEPSENGTMTTHASPRLKPATLRRILSHFCSGLTIVSTVVDEAPVGLTCQSFFSVSLEPPLVALSVGKSSTSFPAIRKSKVFSVNVLAAHQRHVSGAIGRRAADKWHDIPWSRGTTGQPILHGLESASPAPSWRHSTAPRACLLKIGWSVRDAQRMLRADEVSGELWALIEPVLPAGGHQGRPWNDHRLTLEGIIWRYRTGSPWRDVPDHFGAWQSIWERHRRWADDGTDVRMFAAVRAAAPERDEQLRNLLSIDSTIARAHQHSAGALRDAHTGGSIE